MHVRTRDAVAAGATHQLEHVMKQRGLSGCDRHENCSESVAVEEGHLFRAIPQSATSKRRCGYTAPARTCLCHPVALQSITLSLTHILGTLLACSAVYLCLQSAHLDRPPDDAHRSWNPRGSTGLTLADINKGGEAVGGRPCGTIPDPVVESAQAAAAVRDTPSCHASNKNNEHSVRCA